MIDEPDAEQNSRRTYPERSIQELAASLRQDGFLQPLCVRRKGTRFELVFGVRRFRAALLAGLAEVPCTVRDADNNRAFLLNALENLHREQLSNFERVKTIERLANTGLGVREISRRTGFNASTISRWLRINKSAELKQALQDGRIDIARAVVLVDAPPEAVCDLLEGAQAVSTAELRLQVAAIKASTAAAKENDRRRISDALRCLRAVPSKLNEPRLVEMLQIEIDRISGSAPKPSLPISPTCGVRQARVQLDGAYIEARL
jgi:ParB family chromosome partitioning protein